MSYEFNCKFKSEEKKVFLNDLSYYSGISYEYDSQWRKSHTLKLYYFKYVNDNEGYISCSREYDMFDFDDKEECLKVYEDIKSFIKK